MIVFNLERDRHLLEVRWISLHYFFIVKLDSKDQLVISVMKF